MKAQRTRALDVDQAASASSASQTSQPPVPWTQNKEVLNKSTQPSEASVVASGPDGKEAGKALVDIGTKAIESGIPTEQPPASEKKPEVMKFDFSFSPTAPMTSTFSFGAGGSTLSTTSMVDDNKNKSNPTFTFLPTTSTETSGQSNQKKFDFPFKSIDLKFDFGSFNFNSAPESSLSSSFSFSQPTQSQEAVDDGGVDNDNPEQFVPQDTVVSKGESVPQVKFPEKVEGVGEDTDKNLLKFNCKLYQFVTKSQLETGENTARSEWIERGVGILKLNSFTSEESATTTTTTTTGTSNESLGQAYRIIMRRDVTHNVLLNFKLQKEYAKSVLKQGEKKIFITGLDYESKLPTPFLIRFKSDTDADSFLQKIKEISNTL